MSSMTQCPHCQSDAQFLFRVPDLNRRLSNAQFDYFQCPECHLIFQHPIPEDLGSYYQGDWVNYYQLPKHVEDVTRRTASEQFKVDLIRPFVQTGQLFEIGAGNGSFANAAKQAGYDVEAMEMDQACCDFIQSELAIPVTCSMDVIDTLSSRGLYDAITLWHVIEHLPDPWNVLPVLAQHVSPGGVLIIAAPNPASFQFRLFGRRWTHVDAPRHLSLIPIALLVEELVPLGFKLAMQTTSDTGGRRNDQYAWKMYFHYFAARRDVQKMLRAVGLAMSFLALPFDRQPMRGSAYTLIFQKTIT